MYVASSEEAPIVHSVAGVCPMVEANVSDTASVAWPVSKTVGPPPDTMGVPAPLG